MEYYSAIEKNDIMPSVTTWMDIQGITLSVTRQRQSLWSHLYVECNKQNKTKQTTYRYQEHTGVSPRGGGNKWSELRGSNFQL